MKVSVVICTYSEDIYEHFEEAVESVLAQTYDDVEVVIVIDGDRDLYDRAENRWANHEDVLIHCNDHNRGLSASRNRGIELATGDVIAFMDDDAVADERWVEELVSVYNDRDVEAVGGTMTPIWIAGEPAFLPAEFHWLVGVTHRGFPDEGPVRNTFGSNISFRADALGQLDGFDEQLGRKGDRHVQGEETELAARLRDELNGTLYYSPRARVGHKVFAYRTRFSWLVKRAFWQGYSKRVMKRLLPDSGGNEATFLRRLLVEFVPQRVRELLQAPTTAKGSQLAAIGVFTAAVGLGYVYGEARYVLESLFGRDA